MKNLIKARTIITAHNNADFDCLSSMVAAGKLYPDGVFVFPGSQEQGLRDFFIQSATYLFNFYSMKDIDPESVQTIVICDTRQKSRVPHLIPLLRKEGIQIHVFDHHPESDDDLQAASSTVLPWGSTAAILISLIREKGLDLNPEEATIIGLGLYEDTGSFTFASTTEQDLEAAAWLRKKGMDLDFIADFMHRELSAEQVSILNELLEAASTHNINDVEICLTSITTKTYVRDFALLVHKMMEIENIRVLFALARMQDRVHIVARSRIPEVDAGKICASLGGGGHPYAASATAKNKTLAEIQDELFGLLYSHINPQITVNSLMSSPPVVIEQDRTIAQASEVMTRYGLKAIPVVAKDSLHCQGILEHQLADKAQTHGLGEFAVQEYMLGNVHTVKPSESLYTVIEIIINQGQRLVPVVADRDILGVITRTDLIKTLIEEPARIPESLTPGGSRERNIKTLLRNRLPPGIYDLLLQAGELGRQKGYKVYAVGGFVRDILLHSTNLDIDLVVEGDGISFAKQLAEQLGGRLRSHRKFQTAVVILPDKHRIDVATARLEYYEHPAALPTVELSSIKMDLLRRDFSINALAVEINPQNFGRLVDFFGGQRDLKEKNIRVLHSLSFVEDPTRILRAIRFEQRFNFQIGSQTKRLIKNALQLNLFHKLSGKRIFQELKLIMAEESPLPCLQRMQEFNLLTAIHPDFQLTTQKEKLLEKIEKVLDWYDLLYLEPKPERWKVFFLGLLLVSKQEQIHHVAKRLDFPGKLEMFFIQLKKDIQKARDSLFWWQKNQEAVSRIYFILHNLPLEGVLFLMASSRKEHTRKHISMYLSQLKDTKIDISGKDLKALGLSPGPAYNRILNLILTAKLDGQAPDKNQQIELARKLIESVGQEA
ncbi:MAG: CBS domain-containing protein [Desulfohalobiaceae bacterium]|nr:CBS domain-containing protein [Desulfohalobiaceae bacterium]